VNARPFLRGNRSSREHRLGLCLASVVLLACLDRARADARLDAGRDNPLHALLPSAASLHARERVRLEAQVAAAMRALAQVERAELVLSTPDLERLPLDQPPPPARANLLLELSGAGPSDAQALQIVHSVLPELRAEHVRIVRVRAAAKTTQSRATVRVGPFAVAPESAGLLRTSLAVCLIINALLAMLLIARIRARS
jgi:hypothetical protein